MEAKKKAASNAALISANKDKFGEAGLRKLAEKIKAAERANVTPIPPELTESFKIPEVDHIQWLEVETARARGVSKEGKAFNNRVQRYVDEDLAEPPLFIQFDRAPLPSFFLREAQLTTSPPDIKSNFLEIMIVFHGAPGDLLDLYLASFYTLSMTRRDGTQLSYKDVTRKLDADAVWRSVGSLGEGIALSMKVESSKYAVAVAWLSDLLWGSHFDPAR